LIRKFGGHLWGIDSIEFSPDGNYVLSTGRDSSARVWRVDTGRELAVFAPISGGFPQVARRPSAAFSPDGKKVLIINGQFIRIWDLASRRETWLKAPEPRSIQSASSNSDCKRIVASYSANLSQVWDVQTQKPLSGLLSGGNAEYVPGDKYIATISENGTVRLFDAETFEVSMTLEHSGSVDDILISPSGDRMIVLLESLTGNNRISKYAQLWDLKSGSSLGRIGNARAGQVLFSHSVVGFSRDGKTILSTVSKKFWESASAVTILSSETGEVLREFELN